MIFGTIGSAAAAWIMGKVPGLRSIGIWLGAAALLAAGIAFGAWVHAFTEGPRIAREVKSRVELSNLKADNTALKVATNQQADTLAKRARALEQSEVEIEQLRKELEAAREASNKASADPDAVVIPAGDPWLQPRRRR